MFEHIEFIDRYGGQLPSTLRVCAPCEGMGCVPEPFAQCPYCAGTGRVSWLRTFVRVPGWFIDSVRFTYQSMFGHMNPPHWSLWKRFCVGVQCSLLADLKALFR